MKKTYVKPAMYYEHFELSHNIASCSVENENTKLQANHSDGANCTYTLVGTVIFNNSRCDLPANTLEVYCEQTGSAKYNFFCS